VASRYIAPYQIVERCGPIAYLLDLPVDLSAIHNIFHVSQLKKRLRVWTKAVESDSIQLESDLTYPEYPIKLLATVPQSSTKFNGVTTPMLKLLRNKRNFLNPSILIF
jgi:hypothetical protein